MDNNIIKIPKMKTTKNDIQAGELSKKSNLGDNNGGGGNMDNKYVTHQELDLSNEKILHKIDNQFSDMNQSIDKRFSDMNQSIDKRFNDMNQDMNNKFAKVDKQFSEMKVWFLGTILSLIGVMIALFSFFMK